MRVVRFFIRTMTFAVLGLALIEGAAAQDHFTKRMAAIKEEVAAIPADTTGTIVMLGDSITEQFFSSNSMPGRIHGLLTVNQGIGGDSIGTSSTKVGVASRLDQVTKARPAIVFLMIGINELWNRETDPAIVIKKYEDLVPMLKAAAPNAKLVFQSVLPTRDDLNYTNAPVKELNARIQQLAMENGATWLDVGALMKDEKGELKAEYTGDKVHLTPTAYKVWLQKVDETTAELLDKQL